MDQRAALGGVGVVEQPLPGHVYELRVGNVLPPVGKGEPRVVLIDCPQAYDRRGIYGEDGGDYPDNAWRFGLFSFAALHYAMQREHPTWKLHAARYNAVGLEFAREFFNRDTPYGEARPRPALWRRWRPDVVVDNHGVPSHEWAQLFSGFNSPPRFGVSVTAKCVYASGTKTESIV